MDDERAAKLKRDLRYCGRWFLVYLIAMPLAFCAVASDQAATPAGNNFRKAVDP